MKTQLTLAHSLATLLVGMCIVASLGLLTLSAQTDRLAGRILEMAEIHRGVGAVLGIDEDLPLQLARQSELFLHVREPDSKTVYGLRTAADRAGLGIDRLSAETGDLNRIPYAENTIDLIVATQADPTLLQSLNAADVSTALRPDGLAIIGNRNPNGDSGLTLDRLTDWASNADITIDSQGSGAAPWIAFRKPALKGAEDWSHWEKGPDNNPVSNDQIIKAPYMTQFMAHPMYIGMPSITTAAGGRTFLAVGHIAHHPREWEGLLRIIARNGYNGTVLWKRKLPEGYLVHRSAFIATKDVYYMINGDHCLMLDARTGTEKGEIRIPGMKGDWKWMALADGVLYALAGKPDPGGAEVTKGDRAFGGWSWGDLSSGYYGDQVPFGFGENLAAYDLERQTALWVHQESEQIDSRGMAIQGNRMFLYCPDHKIRCLDIRSGEVLWTNEEEAVFGLIEQPGKGLRSTPGFKSMCMVVATPDALIVQGQTRMNVIALSTENGHLLWSKRKFTNNPNAIYVDNKVILGVGERGSHVVIDPVSGEVEDDLKFFKAACTRLTGSTDSFFCRGEGTLRFDRSQRKVLIDGGARPACNDGALPANGMLYIGPWQCDCNLSIIGHIGKCSAGAFRFDREATVAERLHKAGSGGVQAFEITENDWPTYRGNNQRSSSSAMKISSPARLKWQFEPNLPYTPTAPTAAGGLIFSTGNDGKVRALDGESGSLKWEYLTPSPIKYPPTIAENRAYVGGGDGHIYCLEAATGRLLWSFRAAPVERHIMVYGHLSSTWPAHSGVLVHDGVAYFAAGIIDHDGTYVYALDAQTGEIVWQNNSSGHLNAELRKGVSVQGNLSILDDQLLLAGGNQVSPARFNLRTGDCLEKEFEQGKPKANNGKYIGVFDGILIAGGRILHASSRNVSNKNSFHLHHDGRRQTLSFGGIPPAWNDDVFALVNFKFGKLTAMPSQKLAHQVKEGPPQDQRRDGARFRTLSQVAEKNGDVRWDAELEGFDKFEALSLAVCPNAVVVVAKAQSRVRTRPQWLLVAFDSETGERRFQQPIQDEPLPGGLLIDRHGQIIVSTFEGKLLYFGAQGN